MCGIAGFVGPGDRADIARMTGALAHRGPDGEGFFSDESRALFLGHRRLAVIDVEGGAQPMWTADGALGVIFNGEIYNFVELRAELELRGRRFATDHSDTEVLLHGYAEWGEDLPLRLNGMFAFCIYDRVRGRLFIARDRFGEKPLYYAQQNGLFAFASELSAIARHSRFSARLDVRSLQKLMAHGFLPAPNAIFRDCRKLPGGSTLTLDLASGAIAVKPYWRFTLETDDSWLHRREEDLVEELRALVFRAVERRLAADVPLGFFLSGGIDSSAVLAAAARVRDPAELQTFTIGFTEASYDESDHARSVAAAIGAQNVVRKLDLDAARGMALPVLARLDEPMGDASILPTYLVGALARERVTVALSGDGGDELFAGYDPFQALAPAQIYRELVPPPIHWLARRAMAAAPISTRNMSLDFKLRRTLAGLSWPPELWNPVWLGPLDPGDIGAAFEDPLDPEDLYSEALTEWRRDPKASLVDRTLGFYTSFYLPDGILQKVDRATMMSSLESRAAFLDNDLAAFCQRLPHQWKFRNGQKKYLLRKAMEGLVPDAIVRRPKKGFGIPTASWLRTFPTDAPLAPVEGVRMDWTAAAWRDHRAGRKDWRLFLWAWLSLQTFDQGRLAAA